MGLTKRAIRPFLTEKCKGRRGAIPAAVRAPRNQTGRMAKCISYLSGCTSRSQRPL